MKVDEETKFPIRGVELFDKIKDIFREGIEEKGTKDVLITIPLEYSGFNFSLPKKQKDVYHGSSYDIMCDKSRSLCKIQGDLVTEEDYDYEAIEILEKSDCKIFNVHTHVTQRKEEKFPYRESHIHFICKDKSRRDTIQMVNFLKHY